MYIVRDLFRCKPGKAGEVAQKFKAAFAADQGNGGMRNPNLFDVGSHGFGSLLLQGELSSGSSEDPAIEIQHLDVPSSRLSRPLQRTR